MKKWLMVAVIVLATSGANRAHAQGIIEIIRQALIEAIKAADLAVQRVQTETVWLQDAQKVLENAMSKLKLNEISDWVGKQKDLYAEYYDELWKIKSVIAYYGKVKDIIDRQLQLVNEYKNAYALFRQDNHFSPAEIEAMYKVYTGLINESVKNLDQIYLVISAFSTQMTDGQRLKIIDAAAGRIDANYADLRRFNDQNMLVSLQRSKDQNDIDMVKQLYGLP